MSHQNDEAWKIGLEFELLLNLRIWKYLPIYLTLQHKKEFEKMSHQNDEAWKIGLEFELLCMLDFRRVIMDIEKKSSK